MIGAIGSGFDNFGGLYNSYRLQNIPTVDENTVRAQDAAKAGNEAAQGVDAGVVSQKQQVEEGSQETRASRIANLQDISLTFNKDDDFSYIGADSPLDKLDMDKAISDMKKDSVLEQYQYFVGSQANITNTADGAVFLK
ncbi:MAG: hypothetical protein KBS85_05600 [Lachnospiraceae bacterium]|nr:hypothetical protein [Candidatus Merdinaster equi]